MFCNTGSTSRSGRRPDGSKSDRSLVRSPGRSREDHRRRGRERLTSLMAWRSAPDAARRPARLVGPDAYGNLVLTSSKGPPLGSRASGPWGTASRTFTTAEPTIPTTRTRSSGWSRNVPSPLVPLETYTPTMSSPAAEKHRLGRCRNPSGPTLVPFVTATQVKSYPRPAGPAMPFASCT